LELTVDPSAPLPLHRQVYAGIRRAILSGEVRPGERLPATRALAEQLSLARATVAEAYDQLRAEGYISGRRGSGTFVAVDLPEDAIAQPAPWVVARESRVRLSRWGTRIAADLADLPPVGNASYEFDFRPHRVAEDLFPWEEWRTAVDRAVSGERARLLLYPPASGHRELREEITRHVAVHRGVHCRPEQIVMVNGTQEGLNLLAHMLFEGGDRVAVEDPGYPAARVALLAQGLDVVRVPVDGDGMMIGALTRRGPFRFIHVTPSHQEPTGATLSLSRRLALLEYAERNGSIVLEDDYDSEFRYEGRPIESLQGLDRSGLVVYAGTFSKSVLPGLRLGFLVLPDTLAGPFAAAKRMWDSGAPMLEQAALAEFMRSGAFERHIRRARREYRARRDALQSALIGCFGSRVWIGERHGGLNLLVRFHGHLREDEIVQRAGQAGVGVRAASIYFAEPPVEPTFLLGFAALPETSITRGIRVLAEALENG
jgi:GntR family transcriptional regulator / MocR family aminotransferase